jgi:hypothetical protein
MNFLFRKNKMKVGFDYAKRSFSETNTETAGDKNSRNSAKTVLFSAYEFFIPEKIK